MTTLVPITKARRNFAQLVRRAREKFEKSVITVNGKSAAILIPITEYKLLKGIV